jgi:hypothetical protein
VSPGISTDCCLAIIGYRLFTLNEHVEETCRIVVKVLLIIEPETLY